MEEIVTGLCLDWIGREKAVTLSSEHAINGNHCFLGVHISGSKNTHILMNIILDTCVVVIQVLSSPLHVDRQIGLNNKHFVE